MKQRTREEANSVKCQVFTNVSCSGNFNTVFKPAETSMLDAWI